MRTFLLLLFLFCFFFIYFLLSLLCALAVVVVASEDGDAGGVAASGWCRAGVRCVCLLFIICCVQPLFSF